MMVTLIWALVTIFVVTALSVAAVVCVRMIEQGGSQRELEHEKTIRLGMENAWQLEMARREEKPGIAAAPPHSPMTEAELKEWNRRRR